MTNTIPKERFAKMLLYAAVVAFGVLFLTYGWMFCPGKWWIYAKGAKKVG